MARVATGTRDPGPPDFPKEQFERIFKQFLKSANAKAALLLDGEARIRVRVGAESSWTDQEISELARKTRPSLVETARDAGGDELSNLWHQGRRDNVQLALVGSHTLAIVFDDTTTLGMVRLYASQVSSKLSSLLG
jgi:predicted regulator of Ras-like GTPase activity (Roadblock/LC7/MglB family)